MDEGHDLREGRMSAQKRLSPLKDKKGCNQHLSRTGCRINSLKGR